MEENFDIDYLQELANKIKAGTITRQEKDYFDRWYNHHNDELLELPEAFASSPVDIRERLHDRIMDQIGAPRNKGIFHLNSIWYKVLIAALLAFITGLVFFLISYYEKTPIDTKQNPIAIDVPAGGDRAVLVLSDGRKVSLTDVPVGIVTGDQGIQLNKTINGELIYSKESQSTPKINTIVIPWGGQYRLQLADGTKVWLNAATTLKYPTSFIGMRERRVELSGEAYFEVSPDRNKPFIVKTNQQEVTVLGTHFNVNAYRDDNKTVTSLEEGLIQVKNGRNIKIVKPGQEASSINTKLVVQQANLNIALAWKNGKMSFQDTGIDDVMKQISRWYNVRVEYQGAFPDDMITGTISRNSNLSSVLKMLEAMQINFELVETAQGKKLIIKS
jgi:ferric-dicitrate binding protein FerR (iron transport regulator)